MHITSLPDNLIVSLGFVFTYQSVYQLPFGVIDVEVYISIVWNTIADRGVGIEGIGIVPQTKIQGLWKSLFYKRPLLQFLKGSPDLIFGIHYNRTSPGDWFANWFTTHIEET